MKDLAQLRLTVGRALVAVLWAHVPLTAAIAAAAGNDLIWPTLMTAIVAGIAHLAHRAAPDATSSRMTMGVAFIAIVSLILAVCRGSAWQFEVHLYYFAALAILAAFCDRNVILAAAGATALHHLALNFLAPALVFPGGAQLWRVLVHAVILVLEAGTLVWLAHHIVSLFGTSERLLDEARTAADMQRKLEAEAEQQRRSAAATEQALTQERLAHAEAQGRVVGAMATGLERLAAGDLTYSLSTPFAAEYEGLRSNFNEAVAKLNLLVGNIASNASGIRTGVQEISQASDDLSRRTEQQAASLEQTAAALDEITATVRKTADGARHARDVVLQTRAEAEQSGEVVRQAVDAMSGIERSSQEISQIIGVIDEIAFQTNLLALNAGVEAARAGDAGRGFAVVASEVRALAQRSAEAAKEIKTLISTSVQQVGSGVRLVDETGTALSRIATQVSDLTHVVTEISASAQEQSAGLGEVNIAINQMDQVTQQNAAMVEEVTAAATALKGEADGLEHLIARFHVETSGASPLARARAPAGPALQAAIPGLHVPSPNAVHHNLARLASLASSQAKATPEAWEEF